MKTQVITELVDVRCPDCGIVFWVQADYKDHRETDHRTMYCPNGHSLYYPAETEEERLRKLVLVKTKEIQQISSSRDYYKVELGRISKRIQAGICPHCHRHFKNLERHMKSQHQ